MPMWLVLCLTSGLQVIDISDPTNPSRRGSIDRWDRKFSIGWGDVLFLFKGTMPMWLGEMTTVFR